MRTPNLDALAAHGLVFPNAGAPSALASANYATVLTSRLPWNNPLGDGGVLPEDAATLPCLLQQAGYTTGCMGVVPSDAPTRELDVTHHGAKGAASEPPQTPTAAAAVLAAAPSPLPQSKHVITTVGNDAVRFLQRAREPFCLLMSFSKPRPPLDPPEPWAHMYNPAALTVPSEWEFNARNDIPEADARRALAFYYALLSQLDRQIGRLLATLTARGFTNNFILYSAVRGASVGQHGDWFDPDACPYEGVLRVPMLAAGLAGQRQGEHDGALVGLHDLAPTLLEIAGLATPPNSEGRSLTPLLRQPGPFRETALARTRQCRVLRGHRYKLVDSDNPGLRALYDLQQDPFERTNRYGTRGFTMIQNALMRSLDF